MTTEFSTRDLIELSLLDAMGLLDDEERAAFERAFSATSPAVQAHIRREQTRLAQIDFLLPDVEAPAGLRAVVLEAVRKAMAEGGVEKEVAAFMPTMIPSRRVSPLWRAGALGFATAAAVLGYFTISLQAQYSRLGDLFSDNAATDRALSLLGGSLDDAVFSADFQRVVFHPTAPNARCKAALWLNDKDGTAFLVCRNLPTLAEGREYRLVVIDQAGTTTAELTSFMPNGFMSKAVQLKLASNQRLGIVAPSDPGEPAGAPILVTEPTGV